MLTDLHSLESLADGRYHLDGVVGEGGFAAVYRATDTVLNVPRAIKVLSARAARRKAIRNRLNAEARAMARISHPNVLRVYDIVAEPRGDDIIHYVVMDLASGGTLMDWTRAHGRMPPDLAMRYMIQVLSALAAAHASGIVHRDVKPQNILLDDRGVALLADFGIALLAEDGDMRATRTGVAMGSFAYMAPEQRIDARSVGPAADIYAVGTSLYYLITGGNPVDLFAADPSSERWQGIPAELAGIIQCANAYAPEDRFPDARAFAQALLSALDAVGDKPLQTFQPWDPSSFPDPSEHFSNVSRTRNLLEPESLAPPTADAVRDAVRAATYEATSILMAGELPEAANLARTPTQAPPAPGPGGTAPALSPEEIRALGPLQRRLVGAPPTFDVELADPSESPALVAPGPTAVPMDTADVPPTAQPSGRWIGALVVAGVGVLLGVGLMLRGASDVGAPASVEEAAARDASSDAPAGDGAGGGAANADVVAEPAVPVEPVELDEPDTPVGEAEGADATVGGAGAAPGADAATAPEVPTDEVVAQGTGADGGSEPDPGEAEPGDAVADLSPPEPGGDAGASSSAVAGGWTGSFGGTKYVEASLSGSDDRLVGVITTFVGDTEDAYPVVGSYDSASGSLVLDDTANSRTSGRYEFKLSADGNHLSGTHTQAATGRKGSIALSR